MLSLSVTPGSHLVIPDVSPCPQDLLPLPCAAGIKGDFIPLPSQDSFSWCGWLRFVTKNVNTWKSHLGTDRALGRCNLPSLRGVKHFVCVCVCCAFL